MIFELFIAKRIHFGKKEGRRVSRPAIRIAVGGIAVGLAVMIASVAIVIGFKKEVSNKVVGFGSHVQVSSSYSNQTHETTAVTFDQDIKEQLRQAKWVKHAQEFANLPGIVNTEGNFQGVVLKGIDKEFDWSFFKANMKEGEVISIDDSICSNKVVISKKIADMMKIKTDDKILFYCVTDGNVRVRPLTVQGIYSTGFGEYDKVFVLCDMRIIRRLNNWNERQCGGLEILTDDYEHLDNASEEVFDIMGNRFDEEGKPYQIKTIRELNPQIFSWLDLLDMNVIVILVLMALVAGFTMASGLLILILERTNMIGIMKALGADNWTIRRVFIYQSSFLIGKGLLAGNLIGIGTCLLQKHFSIVTLNPDIYYVDAVPVHLTPASLLLTNAGAFAALLAITIAPSYIITKINPAKSIKFE